jgi:hypothetical protein
VVLLCIFSATEGREEVETLRLTWDPIADRAATLLLPFNVFHDPFLNHWVADWALLAAWVAASVLMIGGILLYRQRSELPEAASPVVWVTWFLLVVSTVLLPSDISGGGGIALHGGYFASFAMVALLPARWDRHALSRWGIVVVCLASPLLLIPRLVSFTAEMRDLESAVKAVPPARIVQPILGEPDNAPFPSYPFHHAAAWYSYYRGGSSPYLFATWAKHFPIHVKGELPSQVPGEWQMGLFDYDHHHVGTDYFLVRTKDERTLSQLRQHVPLLLQKGTWMVFGPNPQ